MGKSGKLGGKFSTGLSGISNKEKIMFKNNVKKVYALVVLMLCPVLFYVACSELINNDDSFAIEVKAFNSSILRFTDYTVNHLESIEFNQEIIDNNGNKIGEINMQF